MFIWGVECVATAFVAFWVVSLLSPSGGDDLDTDGSGSGLAGLAGSSGRRRQRYRPEIDPARITAHSSTTGTTAPLKALPPAKSMDGTTNAQQEQEREQEQIQNRNQNQNRKQKRVEQNQDSQNQEQQEEQDQELNQYQDSHELLDQDDYPSPAPTPTPYYEEDEDVGGASTPTVSTSTGSRDSMFDDEPPATSAPTTPWRS